MGLGMFYWGDEEEREKNKVFYICQGIRLWWRGFDGGGGGVEIYATGHGIFISFLTTWLAFLAYVVLCGIKNVSPLATLGINLTTDVQMAIATVISILLFIIVPVIIYAILTGLLEFMCWLACFIDKQLKKLKQLNYHKRA